MQCPYCQQEHPPGSQFCPLTGKKYCQKCGRPVELIWKNCASCGQSLTTGQNPLKGNEELHKELPQPASSPKPRWLFLGAGLLGVLCMASVILTGVLWFGKQKIQSTPNIKNTPAKTNISQPTGTPKTTSSLTAIPSAISTRPSAPFAPYTGKIIFSSGREGDDNEMGNSKIYSMNADGSQQARLSELGWSESPSQSADGKKVVFVSDDKDGRGIYVMNADGSQPTRITPINTGYYDLAPCWSGDGQKIAFTSNRDGNFEIYSMNADGSHVKRLTTIQADDFEPAWSSDGQKIAFTSFRDGYMDIYVMNPDGSNPMRLTTNPMEDSHPDWSADGQFIVFQSSREQDIAIYRMNADGSEQIPLTSTKKRETSPIWLGDGKIAFVSERDGNEEIYIMNADGSEQMRLTENNVSDTFGNSMFYVPNQQPSLPWQPALPLH